MEEKKLILIIYADQAYIRSIDDSVDFSDRNEILFSAITGTYLPLLNMMRSLETFRIPFKMGMVLSAPLCSLLEDPQVQKQYIDFLDRRIALGQAETERCRDNPALLEQAEECLESARRDKADFCDTYRQNLVGAFREMARKGFLELMPTCATYAYLPHYMEREEMLNAQIETGLYAQRQFFGEIGEGFWLPFQGYAGGIERNLRAYGLNYTVVNPRSLLFVKEPVRTGIFAPVRTRNSLVLFGSDPVTSEELCGKDAYRFNAVYRAQEKDIGFELGAESLSCMMGKESGRISTGYRYWANGSDGAEQGGKRRVYSRTAAMEQAEKDAERFLREKISRLDEAATLMEKSPPCLTCVIPAEVLGQTWHEGVRWLEQVIRKVSQTPGAELTLCRDMLQNQFTLPKIIPYPCASNGTGFGEDLLDKSNSWMQRYLRISGERMISLTERFPSETGLKARLLNLGAKELLLAQSGAWPMMMHEGKLPDYAEESFTNSIINFNRVFDALASNTVSTEWLTGLEKAHSLFPWMNYRIFSSKR